MSNSVHPRGCGEHRSNSARETNWNGSSPRVRGTQLIGLRRHDHARFIPAGAGNTVKSSMPSCQSTVHPRGCGEHRHRLARPEMYVGSSPRVRGTRLQSSCPQAIRRFIPAGAGNTRVQTHARPHPAVHPRGCGEHCSGSGWIRQNPGSSPRVRGTLVQYNRANSGFRFIPAGAGNTQPGFARSQDNPVHPRGCGEHFIQSATEQAEARFIPAGAGNT